MVEDGPAIAEAKRVGQSRKRSASDWGQTKAPPPEGDGALLEPSLVGYLVGLANDLFHRVKQSFCQ